MIHVGGTRTSALSLDGTTDHSTCYQRKLIMNSIVLPTTSSPVNAVEARHSCDGRGKQTSAAAIGKTESNPVTQRLSIFDPAKPLAKRKFTTRRVVITPGAAALLAKHNIDPLELVDRHLCGDWGDCDSDDQSLNDFAVTNGLRVMSYFRVAPWVEQTKLNAQDRAELPTVWIITEANRSVTTVMLPTEY